MSAIYNTDSLKVRRYGGFRTMKRGLFCLLLGVFAIASLAAGPCCAQDPRRSASSATDGGQAAAPKVVSLAFLGDLMLGGDVSRTLREQAPERFWSDTLPILRRADAVIANLEGPITTHERRWQRDWKFFHFKADPAVVQILAAGNIRLVNLANNHILDYGDRGLLDTMEALDRAGIGHTGAGRNRAEAEAPRILQVRGLKVGVISATDRMRDFAATPDAPGTNYLEVRAGSPGLDWIERSVTELKHAGAALIVLSLHWGPDLRTEPSDDFRRFAHAVIERGVDVIHGHSAHVVQAIERYRHGIIIYDTGNFIDDYWRIPFQRTTWSFIFRLTVKNGRPASLQLLPVLTHPFPAIATGELFHSIVETMRSRCAGFGTTVFDSTEGLDITLH